MCELDEITLPQACRLLGTSWRDAYNLLLRGTLDGRQERGRWRISRESVERLLQQRGAGVAA